MNNRTGTTPPRMGTEPVSNEHEDASKGRRILIVVIVVLVVGAALLVGWLPRHKRDREIAAKANTERTSLPVVEVQTVGAATSDQQLTLPGTITPLEAAHIYARASGFFERRYVDLGDKVRKGQLLGLISAPDLDAVVFAAGFTRTTERRRRGERTGRGPATAGHLQPGTYIGAARNTFQAGR